MKTRQHRHKFQQNVRVHTDGIQGVPEVDLAEGADIGGDVQWPGIDLLDLKTQLGTRAGSCACGSRQSSNDIVNRTHRKTRDAAD